MVGGVLVERTVKEVLPALTTNRDQVTTTVLIISFQFLWYYCLHLQMVKLIEALNNQITTKGQEINDFKEKNNIRIRNQNEIPSSGSGETEGENKVANQGVLVEAKP